MIAGLTVIQIECPNGHKTTGTYAEDTMRELAEGIEQHFCYMCDKFWYPSEVEKQNIKRLLEMHS